MPYRHRSNGAVIQDGLDIFRVSGGGAVIEVHTGGDKFSEVYWDAPEIVQPEPEPAPEPAPAPLSGDHLVIANRLILTDQHFDPPLVIGAVDINEMKLTRVSGLRFEGTQFLYTAAADAKNWTKPFLLRDTTGITLSGCLIRGDLLNGWPVAMGLVVEGGGNIEILNGEVATFYKGVHFSDAIQIRIEACDIHSMKCDGINGVDVNDMVIHNNHIHDFLGDMASGDHRDMIQFWNSAGTNDNVTITDNRLEIGRGVFTQSLFCTGTGANWLVENNLVRNSHMHGLNLPTVDNLTVRRNDVGYQAQDAQNGPAVARDGTEITGDLATPRIELEGGSTNVIVADNLAIIDGLLPEWDSGGNAAP